MHHPQQKLKIGDYVIGKVIDKSALSQVIICKHSLTKQKVILKKIDKKKCHNSTDIAYLIRELHALKILKHPNIIELYDIIETEKQLFIFMEYAKKGPILNNLVKAGKYNQQTAKQYFRQLISAVNYMHQMGVTHRDLKIENIVIDEQDTVKIIDFGLSNIYKTGQLLFTPCGSPSYAAPEKILHQNYDPLKADLWSCGIILYYFVVGKQPFIGSNVQQLYRKIEKGVVEYPTRLSNSLQKLLSNLLQKQVNKRWDVKQVCDSQWMKTEKKQMYLFKGIDLRKSQIQIDNKLVTKISKQFAMKSDEIVSSLMVNIFNRNTAIYKIMLKRQNKRKNERSQNLSQIKRDFLTDVEFLTPRKEPSISDQQIVSFHDIYFYQDFGQQLLSEKQLIQEIKKSFYFNQLKQQRLTQSSKRIFELQQQNLPKLIKQVQKKSSYLNQLGQPRISQLRANVTQIKKRKYKTQTDQSSSNRQNKLKLQTLRRIYLNEQNKRFGQIINWWKRVREQIKWHEKKINYQFNTQRKQKSTLNSNKKLKNFSTPKFKPDKGVQSTNDTKSNFKYRHIKLPKIGPLFTQQQ